MRFWDVRFLDLRLMGGIFVTICFMASLAIVTGQGFPGGFQPCYTTANHGRPGGECLQQTCCQGGLYVSNLCPNYQNNVRCCYSSNSCTTQCGTCNEPVAREFACRLLEMHERSRIYLKHDHFSSAGNNPYDGASALSNIRDTCYGRQAKRSAYCSAAPGGCVCLKGTMVRALYDYATQFVNKYGVAAEVNALAGSCHSSTSWHYQGNTFDVSCTTPLNHCNELIAFCRAQDIKEICHPGSSCGGHETWVHCALNY